MFPQNSERVVRQKKAPLRVIMGNPPYSVGQKSANDNAQNQKYEILDSRISITYAKATSATNKNSLYDSYIKAFRWSTDRLDPVHGGIIAFVSNGAWLDGNSSDGFRKVLEREFSSIWVFNLRGNARTQGELRQKEAGNVFGSGSRTPIAITLLVKKPGKSGGKAAIHYHDIGDYLNREEKLTIIRDFGSLNRIPWTLLQPNDQGDWISQRNDVFGTFLPLGDKEDKMNKATFFIPYYSNGLKTQRDAWCYNSSIMILKKNIGTHLDFYNEQRIAFFETVQKSKVDIKSFVDRRPQKISWTRALEWDVEKNKPHKIEDGIFVKAYYRPFFKQNLYFSKGLNEMQYQLPKLFPTPSHKNRVICVSANYKDGSVLISDHIPDLHFNGDTQAFPLYYYEENQDVAPTLFDKPGEGKYIRRDGVSDFILERAKNMYGLKGTGFGGRGMGFGVQGLEGLGFGVQGEETNPKPRSPHPIPHHTLSKEDIFYYVYGFLHSPEYRTTFASDLKKMLPRLPLVEDVRDFWAFSNAGRRLAELHIHYESVSPYEGLGFGVQGIEGLGFGVQGEENQTLNPDPQTLNPKPHTLNPNTPDPKTLFRVEKMRYPKKGQTDTIIYNSKIVITNIPAKAYEYVVNGKSAIDWIMERYAVTTHKESGIKNDPNDWAEEVGNPRYILDLLLSIINVSMQTVEIVEGLPKVGFLKDDLPDLKSEGCGLEL
ncbi:MAG: type ISP restriction/modification enzyme [Bacteroidia bacterium]|nr:type ISP restriction/modification enzyme [Bacteroidia bacterium]